MPLTRLSLWTYKPLTRLVDVGCGHLHPARLSLWTINPMGELVDVGCGHPMPRRLSVDYSAPMVAAPCEVSRGPAVFEGGRPCWQGSTEDRGDGPRPEGGRRPEAQAAPHITEDAR
ncbi:hypothetical protein AVEN_193935-1 [Araneus ventricosus]|uniref:Uncharacterized protein n=1 Tax=Araneus ventricosus TaxID=182803 RepID=A0A4Y2M8Y6_ARAVE|nr:hypothetical protein AVEN_193935-1 [Araneus ventricosus]